MLKMPQIMNPNPGHGKPFRQMRAHRFDSLAQPRTDSEEVKGVSRGHAFAWGRDDHHAMPLGQQGLAIGVDKAFICRNQFRKACDLFLQQPNVVGTGRQQGIG